MLRVKIQNDLATPSLTMEGRLVGAFAEDTKAMVLNCELPPKLVDLTDLSFADPHGETVLLWLAALGAQFIADSSYALDLCERLRLPIFKANGSGPRRREGGRTR